MDLYLAMIKMAPEWIRLSTRGGDIFFDIKRRDSDKREGGMIAPTPQLVRVVYNNLFEPLQKCLTDLEQNVSFLEIDLPEDLEWFRVSCDWCSICNGIVHTAVENLKRNPTLECTIDSRIERVVLYLDDCLAGRQYRPNRSDAAWWCWRTFDRVTPALVCLSHVYLQLEQIELRWCPFKRSKAFYYRNSDSRYAPINMENIIAVGKILATSDTVTCNDCPHMVNRQLPRTKNKPSLFQPLMDVMNRQLAV